MTRNQIMKLFVVGFVVQLGIGLLMRRPDEPIAYTMTIAVISFVAWVALLAVIRWIAKP